ncbi:MAG: L-threonylcarbamoyladenylate synthase [Kineosporiaceae bacterium]
MPATGLEEAAATLRSGGLVAFPTETVYGLGANALDATAVAGIFRAKRRPSFDPLIVHLAGAADAARLTSLPPSAAALAARFWPGPLTLVLPRPRDIPGIVTSGLDTVAVRVPDHVVARELLLRAGVPVAAPSANRFGRLSPTTADHVRTDLDGEVDVIVDGGPTRWGVESTVVDARGDRPVVLRLGALTVEDIEAAVGAVEVRRGSDGRPATPGALPSHYAPGAPLRLATAGHPPPADRGTRACLAFRTVPPGYAAGEALSPDGNLVTAAARLFEALHRLDAATRERGLVGIVAEPLPEEGLGRAVNDRLRRAAAAQD